jgi:phage replication-related protein YjqB (UPF0714/DUF867 family)
VRFSELLATPGVEEHCDLQSRFGILAFHGGNLERTTDDIAARVAARSGASLYTVTQPHPLREHISSSKVLRTESEKLDKFLHHVDIVIALHGYGREGHWTSMLLGGSNRGLAARLATNLRVSLPEFLAVDDIESIPTDLRGLHPTNPVNVPRLGGVQLELPPRVRGLTPHAATMPKVDGMIAWTHALIDALTTTVLSFSELDPIISS